MLIDSLFTLSTDYCTRRFELEICQLARRFLYDVRSVAGTDSQTRYIQLAGPLIK